MKRGLILEGGAMRGLFSAGVIDVMMEHGLHPDGIVGVSAGAAFGCNYKSGQHGRALRYNQRFARDSRYCGIRSLISSGDLFNAEFAYHVVPNVYDIFDSKAFESNPMEYYVVCTDVSTGNAVYHKCDNGGDTFFEWVRASASMPLVSNVVEIDGMYLLDGGISDSIPLEFFENEGYDANIVVLTQPEGYMKHKTSLAPLMKVGLRKYPELLRAMLHRHEMYNRQLDFVREAEATGRCMVIRPENKLPIGHVSHSPANMERVYELGRHAALKSIPAMRAVWKQ
ncbi:patatin family protein [uncultured Muribaculum sp.]|uniref:patatin-like phospholipase family protein n=1 Tax=uncultured Muribaculum sp. TaxID=1918613 RepID=UPI0025DAA89A|nr:patatin family protein [uncultured Muribaculum sp.]